MRKIRAEHGTGSRCAVRLAGLAGALILVGCGATSTDKARHTPSTRKLHIGESATLDGNRPGERIEVTLVAFMRSLGGGSNDHPELDDQYMGARISLRNDGSVTYTGNPVDSLSVIATESSETSKKAMLTEGPCANAFAQRVTLTPGQSAEGCVPTQIAVTATAAYARFAPYRGAPALAAEWSLTTARKARAAESGFGQPELDVWAHHQAGGPRTRTRPRNWGRRAA